MRGSRADHAPVIVTLPMTLLVDVDLASEDIGTRSILVDVRWSPVGGHQHGVVVPEPSGGIPAPPSPTASLILRVRFGSPGPGRPPLPSPEEFVRRRPAPQRPGHRPLSVENDDARGSLAARLWWMLDAIGARCSLLDGGLAAWTGPLKRGTLAPGAPSASQPRPWPPDRLADAQTVLADPCTPGAATVLDVRASGALPRRARTVRPVAGHIPGALNASWTADTRRGGPVPHRGRTSRGLRLDRGRGGWVRPPCSAGAG